MSIRINKDKCVGCNKCIEICPGSLIYKNEVNKAYIKYEESCWGCTACLKECNVEAIEYYLGQDIGGQGAYMTVKEKNKNLIWKIYKDDEVFEITTNRVESNRY
ncbi:4Fe-4S dicluster domain-containing protein [Clostridium nigeriense]|uniref:4Fe-4S dicluster domain-containing protein n=1 Tax=Clostridium nigeriense TaxID=1805470 RepID=UPI003D330A6B